jgi:proteasome assembly chaperone (PAC2) family protein
VTLLDEPLEGELVVTPVVVGPAGHMLGTRDTMFGVEYICECGQWDGWASGPRAAARVLHEHEEHVKAATGA